MHAPAMAVLLVALAVAGCMAPEAPLDPPPATPVVMEAIEMDTEAGRLRILLYPEAAPATVELMKAYVREGYYVGRAFHRVVPGHVIQVTDAAGGATDDERRVPLEPHAGFHFSAGAVGIARDTDPSSGGPQFFIMDFATSHLDGNYTVWGQVDQGLDVVHRIARGPSVAAPRAPTGVPSPFPFDRMALEPVAITAARLATVTLTAEEAARYPMQVAQNVRSGAYRHSLDWPADLRAGHAADLTWYVRPTADQPVPVAAAVRIWADGVPMAVANVTDAPGAYAFRWTPAPGDAGPRELRLDVDGVAWASLWARVA